MLAYSTHPSIPSNITDNTERFYYYRTHYFDGIDWQFAGILRTPVFAKLIDEYLNNLTVNAPDSLIVSCDKLLKKTEPNKGLFQYTLIELLNKFAQSKLICQDAIYVHLVDNYYAKGKAVWMNDPDGKEQLNKILTNADRLRPSLCNKMAYNFTAQDNEGNVFSLSSVKGNYTVLYFWDPECAHCVKQLSKLNESIALLNAKNISTLEISIGTNRALADKVLLEKQSKLTDIRVMDLDEIKTIKEKYNIVTTPEIYILDENKKIVYKSLDVETLLQIVPDL